MRDVAGRARSGRVSKAGNGVAASTIVSPSDDAARAVLPKQTTDADRLVGLRITALRKAKGLSQTALGQAIGVTFQQVQKYEKGQNRIGAGRLSDIAHLLEVPVSTFFDEARRDPEDCAEAFAFLRTPGAVDLLRAFAALEDGQVRRDVVALVRSIARSRTGSGEVFGKA